MGKFNVFARQFLMFIVIVGMIVYVAADAIRGAHGLVAKQRIEAKIKAIDTELSSLRTQRAALERDAELLGAKAASEPALLDEEARSLLDLAKPTDIVIVADPQAGY